MQGNLMPGSKAWSGVGRWLVAAATIAATLLVIVTGSGCTRGWYRRQADAAAYEIIYEKSGAPLWPLDNFTINIRPDSRMHDPFNPDREPMPPDDPAAHRYMHSVDDKNGWPFWHRNGDVPFVENPFWREAMPLDERGAFVLDRDTAVRQAILQSRRYQQEMEDLYLSALDVSFERFRFDSQFFSSYDLFYDATGPKRLGNAGQSSSLLTQTYGVNAQRLTATGGELMVGFANTLMWQFAGPDTQNAQTIINFNFLQPLLRGAGRARVLERLTLSERLLLTNVRAMERWKQEFYVEITTGRASSNGVQRRGGVFGGAGLESFVGVGSGGFGAVGSTTTGGNGGGVNQAATGAVDAGGYLGLLQDQLQIRNQEDNIEELTENLDRQMQFLQETRLTAPAAEAPDARKERELREQLQVEQARQALYNSKSVLLNTRNTYLTQLDTFKINMGLPPDLCLEITDPVLDEFRRLNDETTKQNRRQSDALRREIARINRDILALVQDELDPTGKPLRRVLPWSKDLANRLGELHNALRSVRALIAEYQTNDLSRANAEIEKLRQAVPYRVEELAYLKQKYDENKNELCALLAHVKADPTALDPQRVIELPDNLQEGNDARTAKIADLGMRLDKAEQEIEALLVGGDKLMPVDLLTRVRDDVAVAIASVVIDLRDNIRGQQLLLAQARTESIRLAKVQIEPEEAIQTARDLRLDWMNARAALVDSWRLIQFNANALRGDLSIVFAGDIQNRPGENPFSLDSNTGRLRVGLQYDAPLTRVAERNTYRQSLIEYQQARRAYYTYEDTVYRSLRQTLRTMEINKINFEYRRYALRTAARQIILNDEILQVRQGQSSGATATRDAVSALSDLLNAQNDFLGVWVNYEVLRRWLDLDLGTMQLGPDGTWMDPGEITARRGLMPKPEEVLPAEAIPGIGPPGPGLPAPAELPAPMMP